MRRTARTSIKSANAVDYENLVAAVDCENSVYVVDCENSEYAVDYETAHNLGVCGGQQELAQSQQMWWTMKTWLMRWTVKTQFIR